MRFVLLDLRAPGAPTLQPPSLAALARPVPLEMIASTLQELLPQMEDPVVLICENGAVSRAQGETLAAKGYRNVFVVEGGSEQLLKEWRQTTHV